MDEQLVQQAFLASQIQIINVHQFYPEVAKPKILNTEGKRILACLGHNTGPLKLEEKEDEELEDLETVPGSNALREAQQGLMVRMRGFYVTADEILDANVEKNVGDTQRCMQEGKLQKELDYVGRAISLRSQQANLFELRAEVYFRLHDYVAAIKSYKRAMQLDRPERVAMLPKASKAELRDVSFVAHHERSVICDEQMLNVPSNTAVVSEHLGLNKQRLSLFYFMYAQSLFDLKRYVEALEAYCSAVALQPDCVYYHISCLACLAALKRTHEALSVADRLIEDGCRTADMYLLRARLFRFFKNYTASFVDVQAALRLQPDHPVAVALSERQREEARVNAAMADELTIKRRFKEALQHISLAIEMDPSVIDYHLKRGITYRHLHEYNMAIDSFMTAMSRTDSAAAELSIVQVPRAVQTGRKVLHVSVASEAKQSEQQVELADQPIGSEGQAGALVAVPTGSNAVSRILNGVVRQPEDAEKAERDKQVALLAQRQLVLTYSDFAVDCLQKGFCNEGILLLNKAIKVEKREKGLYVNRGDCFFKLQEYDFALADYEQALELEASDFEVKKRIAVVYYERAKAMIAQNHPDEAVELLGHALDYSPLDASLYAARANLHYSQQAFSSAQQDTILALLIDPRNDKTIGFAIKLFNKQSVTEVLQSRLGEQMKARYKELLSGNQSPVADSSSDQPPTAPHEGGRYVDSTVAIAGAYQTTSHLRQLRVSSALVVSRVTNELATTVQLEHDLLPPDEPLESQPPLPTRPAPQPAAESESESAKGPQKPPTKPRRSSATGSDVLLVLRKRNIEERVKQQYQERASLWQHGPRIVPAEVANDSLVSKPKQTGTGWRKFSRGIQI